MVSPEGLVLNELMASNAYTITDDHGDHDDWIEIANMGNAPIDLFGLALADHNDGSGNFEFPAIILEPGEYLVVWADEEPAQGNLHAPSNWMPIAG